MVPPVSCSALAQRWNMPLEMAYDLAALALYDIVIYCDDSGSMIFAENGEFGAHVMPPPPVSWDWNGVQCGRSEMFLLQSLWAGQEHAWAYKLRCAYCLCS